MFRLSSLIPKIGGGSLLSFRSRFRVRLVGFFIVLLMVFAGGLAFVIFRPAAIPEDRRQQLETPPPPFDATFFNKPQLRSLKEYGSPPVPVVGGRAIPFSP